MRKIKFQEVEFRNFLSFGNTWQKFTFGDGLNIIQGHIVESEKSNGAGKSSLTELIPYALFGRTIKKVKKAEVTNWYNGKNCEVRLKFTVDDVPHEIRRGIKPNKLDVYINGDKLPQLASAVDYQNTIEEDIIGMDFGTFQNLIYFSPNNTISIINAGKPEKRKFLESLFDLSVYSDMGKTLNEKLTSSSKNSMLLTVNLENFQKDINRLQQEIEEAVIPNTRKYRDKVAGLQLQYEELVKIQFDISEEELDREQEHLQRCKDTLKKWEDANRRSVETISVHQQLIKNLGDVEDLEKKTKDINERISLYEYEVNLTSEEDETIVTDRLQQKELMKDELKEIVTKIRELEQKIAILDSMIANDDDNINIAKNRKRATVGVCDSCGQEITEEILQEQVRQEVLKYELDKDAHQRQVRELIKERDELNKEKDELYQKIKEEADSIKALQEDIDRTKDAKEKQKALLQRLEDLPDAEEIKKLHKEYSEVIEFEVNDQVMVQAGKIHMAEIDIELSEARVKKLSEELGKKHTHEHKIESLKKEIKDAVEYYDEMVVLTKKVEQDTEKKKQSMVDTELKIKETEEQLKKINNLNDYLNYLKSSLKDENVKRFAISTLIPYLNQQANIYLSESGFPYVVTIDSWLDVSIRGLGVSDVSYGSLSGGETKCIDMAVQLACNDIASMMAKTSLNLMVLDEVLDSSVDSLGVQALLNIVRVRQRTNNDCVYVITHRNEIDEFTFDSVVRIMNQDKFSTVEVV